MLKNKLYNILQDINSLNRSPESVMEKCVSEKLDNALNVYYKELNNTIDYLLSKNSIAILKGISKEFGKEKKWLI